MVEPFRRKIPKRHGIEALYYPSISIWDVEIGDGSQAKPQVGAATIGVGAAESTAFRVNTSQITFTSSRGCIGLER